MKQNGYTKRPGSLLHRRVDRREFLVGTTSAALLLPLPFARGSSGETPESSEAASLAALLDRMFDEQMKLSPEDMTSLGLDVGDGAWARSRLDDRSAEGVERINRLRRTWRAELGAIDRGRLTGLAAANYDTVHYRNEIALEGAESFRYGRNGFPWPYILSQINGSYQSVPDFLDSRHVIENAEDAEAYLARLSEFADVLDAETERAKDDARSGIIPPGFIVDTALSQMQRLRQTPGEQTTLVASLVRRTREKKIEGAWGERAMQLVSGSVWSALDRQIALMEEWRSKAPAEAGAWRLPHGADYYRFAMRYQTTTSMAPADIHELGLELVSDLSAEADRLLDSQGSKNGSVGRRVAALFDDPRFMYPNTEAGKAELLAELNDLIQGVTEKLPGYFGTLPNAGLEIRRVPAAIEAGSPGGYYVDGSLDGSRPGAYYINLRDTAEVPRWTLPTLTYHEGIPGHHLQGAIVLETPGLPMIRRTLWFAGYGEGWALYAEQLADEMGLYANDPWGRLGYLHDALFRAVRLVVDTGLHAKRWTREEAIRYFVETTGDPVTVATTEVDRYCVWPGQACSYMIGKMTWLRLRESARARMGGRFDISEFHNVGLETGPMPLELLEKRIDAWSRGDLQE